MQRKEGAFLQAPTSAFSLWLSLLPLYFKHFLLTCSPFQAEEKRKKQRKKNHREEKNANFIGNK
jgi:hypothetical protein